MKSKPTLYGKSIERDMLEGTCSACRGERDKEAEDEDEAVLLCDGKGCCREYHLSCTDPRLMEVPEGDFFCMDCEPDGTTRHLEQYFNECSDERSRFNSSREYVEHLFKQHMQMDADGDGHADDNKSSADASTSKKRKHDAVSSSPRKLDAPPTSEICRAKQLHNAGMDDTRWRKVAKKPNESSPREDKKTTRTIDRDFFVGKTIKVYCSKDNQYHTGRIIDWRSAVAPGIEPAIARGQYYGKGIQSSTEFLARFPCGLNGRKRTLLQWMILEEHSCAVSTSIVMTLRDKGRGMNGWRPAQIMLRSCLELIPIRDLVSVSDHYALVTFFGADTSIYLDVKDDAVDVYSKSFWEEFKRKTYTSPGKKPKTSQVLSQTMALTMNTMNIELQEQKRTAKWQSLPIKDVYHEKALTVIDEYSSELLLEDDDFRNEKRKTTDDGFPAPDPCPLIQRGLDKQWISDRLTGMGGEKTLDSMPRMEVRRTRLPACVAIALINCSHKTS